MEGTEQHWPEWMGMECPGTCLDSRATKSTATLYLTELREHLTKRSDGGEELPGSGWILGHLQKKST